MISNVDLSSITQSKQELDVAVRKLNDIDLEIKKVSTGLIRPVSGITYSNQSMDRLLSDRSGAMVNYTEASAKLERVVLKSLGQGMSPVTISHALSVSDLTEK